MDGDKLAYPTHHLSTQPNPRTCTHVHTAQANRPTDRPTASRQATAKQWRRPRRERAAAGPGPGARARLSSGAFWELNGFCWRLCVEWILLACVWRRGWLMHATDLIDRSLDELIEPMQRCVWIRRIGWRSPRRPHHRLTRHDTPTKEYNRRTNDPPHHLPPIIHIHIHIQPKKGTTRGCRRCSPPSARGTGRRWRRWVPCLWERVFVLRGLFDGLGWVWWVCGVWVVWMCQWCRWCM